MIGIEVYELDEIPGSSKNVLNDESKSSLNKTEYEKQIRNNIQSRTLLLTFLRMGSKRKIDLLTNFFQQVRNIRVLANTLNTFFAVNTKLISYSKISTDSNSLYDQFIHDDDRMMDADVLEESILSDIEWFKNLEDTEQMTTITSLLRLSGGNIIKKMYIRLMKIFNKRNSKEKQNYKEYTSSSDLIFAENDNENLVKVWDFPPSHACQDDENNYNPDCPTSKKVMESRKQWQASMLKLRKEIETEVQKLNEPILQRMKEKQTSREKDSIQTKGSKISRNEQVANMQANSKLQDNNIDWIQFLPIWSVKKIFSYLDERTLQNLKNVNNYWAIISKEVLAENKTREYMNATLKKSEEFLVNLTNFSPIPVEADIKTAEIVMEPSGYRKRMQKQRRTGTFLRRKEKGASNLISKCVLNECFKEFDTPQAQFLGKLQSFPVEVPKDVSRSPETVPEISGTISLSEATTLRMLKTKQAAEQKPPSIASEKEDMVSSSSSNLSLVPSIVVSMDNMESW